MALNTLQNFYKATVSIAWAAGTGNRYVSVLPTPSSGRLVINPSDISKREIITYTATGTDGSGTYITISARGVGGTTDQAHDVNESIRMNFTAQDYADIQTELNLKTPTSYLDTDGTLAANSDTKVATQKATKTYADTKLPANYLDTDVTLAANSDTKVASQKATKAYADGLAIAGAPNASTTTKGIVEEATQAEIEAGTAAGATAARLFMNPSTFMGAFRNLFTVVENATDTYSLTTTAGQRVIVFCKFTSTSGSRTYELAYNGVVKDSISVTTRDATGRDSVFLMYSEVPGAATANVTINNSPGELKMMIIKF